MAIINLLAVKYGTFFPLSCHLLHEASSKQNKKKQKKKQQQK